MAVHNRFSAYTVIAAEDLSAQSARFKVISLAGTIAPGTSRAAGVLVSSCRSGEQATYAYDGIVKVAAGAAINTVGYPITVANSGWVTAAASGGAHVGRALETCASGDLVTAIVNFANISLWPGV